MAQLSYSINMQPVAYPGQLVDIGHNDVLSALAVSANIPYGVLVVNDSANSNGFDLIAGKVPAAATDITTAGLALGIAVSDQAHPQNPGITTGPVYLQGTAVPCCRQGRVWVYTEDAVVNGAPVFVRYASGAGGTQTGSFRADADSASAAQLPGAVFRSTTTAAGYAVVELNLV